MSADVAMGVNHWCPAVWNVLHDATVVGISGTVPGLLRLTVDCDYLRDRIDHPGNYFYITLSDCTRFAYRPWNDDSAVIEDLQALSERRLWILSADPQVGFCKVHCNEHVPNGNGGVLEVAAATARVTLDGERPISQADLESIAEEYWQELGARSDGIQSRDDQ